MSGFFQFLQGQPFFVIFGVVALGMALGKLTVGGISLGSVVCILLAGLVTSIWSCTNRKTNTLLELPDCRGSNAASGVFRFCIYDRETRRILPG